MANPNAVFSQVPIAREDEQDIFESLTEDVAFGTLRAARFRRVKPLNDMELFLADLMKLLTVRLLSILTAFQPIRVGVCVYVMYEKVLKPEETPIRGFLRTSLTMLMNKHAVMKVVHSIIETVRSRHINFMRESSGLRLKEVQDIDLYSANVNPLAHVGEGFARLPNFLAKKKAIVNVQNRDNRCFGYALLSSLHPANHHPERAYAYDRFFDNYPALKNLDYPISLEHLEEIERKIQIPFNVFTFTDDDGEARKPAYLSRISPDVAADLLFWDGHFAWIRNFARFASDITKSEHKQWICKRCLGHFTMEHVLQRHQLNCVSIDDFKQIYTMPEAGTKLSFKNVRYQQRYPFIVYADFEALTTPIDKSTNAKKVAGEPIHSYQLHKPISVGLKLVGVDNRDGPLSLPYECYTGEDATEWFLRKLLEYRMYCDEYLFRPERLTMTNADQIDFSAATECYICDKPFPVEDGGRKNRGMSKVRDHDHISGKYRGAAHSHCNLKLRTTYKLSVFLHNFRNYDSHLIVMSLDRFPGTAIDVIGQTIEKYLTLTWDETITFKDSLQFLSGSLEQLVECLLQSGAEKFVHFREGFVTTTDEDGIRLLLRKGVYPYDYMSNADRLKETSLPSRADFFNRLQNLECTEENYAHAQQVWDKFGCKTMQDYHELYLKTDVLLLADVFESFRTATLSIFGLDPSYYVSAPQLAWDCMMLMTGCVLTLLSDPAMFSLINENLRGGISVIMKRYAKANNKYMGELYDASQPSSYILYLDANNLYGWAMSEPLPYDEFEWLSEEEFGVIDWTALDPYHTHGFFVECDLDYPDELHDAHNEYPLAPERIVVEDHLLSEEQGELREQYEISHTATAKLVPNFFPKKRQLLHYRNLRYYLEHGLVLTKVHRVIRFLQRRWLQPYVQANTDLRAKSKDPVEIRLRKDMNNSIYGKTCENLTKRTDIKLVTTKKQCDKLTKKAHCRRFEVFTGQLAAVELTKVRCLINKPTYVGFAVLELSKLCMYQFHYDRMRAWYPEAELLFTDTDSLVYQIPTEDLYADLASRADEFDFSNYPSSHALFSNANKMVMGKMKDESNGAIITEFVGLRPKMYSYKTLQADASFKESKRAKGIQRAAMRDLVHADYLTQLRTPAENYVNIRRIGQKHHRVYTLESEKRGLCAFDDKRFLLADGVHTYAHGHCRIREQQQKEPEDEAPDTRSPSPPVLDESGEPTVDFVVLSTAQGEERQIRTSTRGEALRAITGLDLRSALSEARICNPRPATSPMLLSTRKRHAQCDDSDTDDEADTAALKRAAHVLRTR